MSKPAIEFYEFGPFRLDPVRRLLLKGTEPVSVTSKVFDTLLALLESSGEVLEKDELMERVWGDTIVEEASIAQNIFVLRKALGERANEHQYVVTVPGRGYRFVASVNEVRSNGDGPGELERIADTAPSKDGEARDDTLADVLTEIKGIKQESEAHPKVVYSVQTDASQHAKAARGSGPAELQSTQVESDHIDKGTPARKTSSAEYLVSEIKQHRMGLLVTFAILLGVVALSYGVYRFAAPHGSNAHFQNLNKMKFTPLTTVGSAIDATVSPDGRLIVFVQLENGEYSLWTKAVATDSAIQIVPPTEAIGMGKTTFSPDGNYVYYSVTETSGPEVIYQVKVLGGTPKKVLTKDFASPITFSPDGKQFAFVGDCGETQLTIVNTDGTGERILARGSRNESFSGGGPSWSPDGKIIATGAFVAGSTARQVVMVGVAVKNGEVKPLSQQSWNNLGRVEWFRDGSGLVLTAQEKPADKSQLWQLSYPGGEVRRITNDLDDYGPVSLTTDSGALVTTRARKSSNIWVVPNGDASQARQLTSRGEAREGAAGVAWTPEGSIVYSSKAAGGVYSNIWVMSADGSNPRQLTDAPANDWFPAVSPDGRYIVFSSNLSGKFNLWRMDMNGGNLEQLTNGLAAYAPDFSPDGRWVACMFKDHGEMSIWKFPVDGGSPVQLNETSAAVPTISSDGKLIAYDTYDAQAEKKTKAVIISSESGAPVKVLDYTPLWNTGLQWSPDDSSIIYINLRQGGANLWRLPLDGSPAQQLTAFKSEQIFSFHFTHDGRQLVCARGTTTSDVVMISETK